MVCHNCFQSYSGNYCNHCGQKSTDNKYTIKGMVSDLFLSVLHVEKKGLPYTVRYLTLRPGESIKNVMQGQRLYLYPPFKYLVLMGAIVIILSLRYKFFHNEYTSNNSGSFLTNFILNEHLAHLENFFRFAEDKATILNIATIPVFALMSWSLVSFKQYNLAENLIINTFITAHQLFFLILTIPFIELFPSVKVEIIFIYSIVIVLYNIWVYAQIFDGNKFWVFVKSTFAVVIAFAYQMPVNLLIYSAYEKYFHKHFHWALGVVMQNTSCMMDAKLS